MSSKLCESVRHLIRLLEQTLVETKGTSYQDIESVRWLVCLLDDICQQPDHNLHDYDDGESAPRAESLRSPDHLESCHDQLRELDESVRQLNQVNVCNADESKAILHRLFHAANMLNITLRFNATAKLSITNLQQLQNQLTECCEWFYDQDAFRSTLESTTRPNDHSAFKLEEAELATTTTLPPRRTYATVCPRARLPEAADTMQNSFEIEFTCHCSSTDHKNLLYKVFGSRSIPVEVTDSSAGSTSEMILRRPDAVVILRLSNLSHTYFHQLEALSGCWAQLWSEPAVYDGANEVLTVSDKTITVLRTKASPVLSSLDVLSLEFFVTSHRMSFRVPWTPKYMQLFQYATSDTALASRLHSGLTFFDEPSFYIFVSEQHPMNSGVDMNTLDFYKIKVSLKTMVKYSKEHRKVTVLDVDCAGNAKTSRCFRCSEVQFEFASSVGAEMFFSNVENMRNRLFEMSLHRLMKGENIVFRHISSSELNALSIIHIAIVSSPSDQVAKYRLIAVSSDRATTICYQLKSLSYLKHHDAWSPEVSPSQSVWTIRRERSKPVLTKQEWNTLQTATAASTSIRNEGSGPALSRSIQLSSNTWFEELDEVNVVLRASKVLTDTGRDYRPVKIAVIDTGLKMDPKNKARRQIARYKDFVTAEKGIKHKTKPGQSDDSLDSMTDATGHGTFSAELILKVYKDAQLYIARIFESDRIFESGGVQGNMEKYLMADAIRWAVNHEVDIISISAGFQEGVSELYEAVSEASKKNILIFASAANWSYTYRAAVPAKYPHVFCIFSTDAGCKNSRNINPEALENTHNFAFLGENVQITPNERSESGTSVSTAIAAGFAARILDFARQPECRGAIGTVADPATELGMGAILQSLANKDGGYACVRPLRLLIGDQRVYVPDGRDRDRKRVVEFLTKVLKQAL